MINIDIYQPVFYVNSEYIHDYSILQCGYQTVEAGKLYYPLSTLQQHLFSM